MKQTDRIAALSLAIARHEESEPKWTYCGQPLGDGDAYISDGGFYARTIGTDSYIHPETRLITEFDIAMRLLKKLLENDPRTLIAIADRYDYFGRKDHSGVYGPCSVIQGPELAQAIAEAYAKAENLEVE